MTRFQLESLTDDDWERYDQIRSNPNYYDLDPIKVERGRAKEDRLRRKREKAAQYRQRNLEKVREYQREYARKKRLEKRLQAMQSS